MTSPQQVAFADRLQALIAETGWQWHGGQFAGRIASLDELTVTDVADLVCWLRELPDVACIEVSPPYRAKMPSLYLRIHTDCPALPGLLALYRAGRLSAAVVIDALGGFNVARQFDAPGIRHA